jgi:4-O-beta-D-mannosyl-D-glucose phosphorylase
MTTIQMTSVFQERKNALEKEHKLLIEQKNEPKPVAGNGIYERYNNPVVTAAHAPLEWRFDFNENTNPFLQERIAINAAFNAGAMKWNGK